jgi:hypothetical protein
MLVHLRADATSLRTTEEGKEDCGGRGVLRGSVSRGCQGEGGNTSATLAVGSFVFKK